MPEWSNGAVSKTVELLVGSGGSNPPLSAERPRRYQRRGLSAERGGWPTKSAWFYPHPDLPRGEGLVASLRDGSGPVFRQSFLHLLASLPFSFHNGSISCISLPLWNGFSAASLLWASWTALSPQSPSTTAAFPAILCRCGKNTCTHLPKVIRKQPNLTHLWKVVAKCRLTRHLPNGFPGQGRRERLLKQVGL